MITCATSLRDGPCEMEQGHKGRCSTVTFFCDGCQQTRRGVPFRKLFDGNDEVDAVLCFMCVKVPSYWAGR